MLRMILADDEPVITRGIRKLLDWNMLGIEITGEYEDGRKALEAIVREQPDLALLDISMPGMSGVEILKECRAMENKVAVIFISGFQDFEYAKAALQYGAVDYLLKPVIREELLRAIEKGVLLAGREETAQPDGAAQPDDEAINYGLLMEDEERGYVPVYVDLLYDRGEDEQIRKLVHFSLFSFLEEYLSETGRGIVFQKDGRIAVVLKGVERAVEGEDVSAGGGRVREIVEKIREESVRVTRHTVFYVIGDAVHSMSEIPGMFRQCLERSGYLFFADKMTVPILNLYDRVFHGKGDSDMLEEARQGLFDAIMAQNEAQIEACVRRYARLVLRLAEGKKEDACFYFCTAVRYLEERCVAMELPGRRPQMKELLERGRACESFGEMEALFAEEFGRYAVGFREAAAGSDRKDIQKAKAYIEEHYKENLSLQVLAEEIHMNPYYFSSFFKKNTGENFKDYVNRVRIEHAVPLLLSSDLKTYEIAERVGFGDIRMFNAAFAKIYQETPGNYRKRVRE